MKKSIVFYPKLNPNGAKLVDCLGCGKRTEHHAKGFCYSCYKKQWQPLKVICKNCGRLRNHHSYGLCNTCNTRLNHYDTVLSYNAKKQFNLDLKTYKELTKACICCGFNKIVELHHLDSDKKNNFKENLVPLCPNCHKMIHSHAYFKEIITKLEEKGYDLKGFAPRKLN